MWTMGNKSNLHEKNQNWCRPRNNSKPQMHTRMKLKLDKNFPKYYHGNWRNKYYQEKSPKIKYGNLKIVQPRRQKIEKRQKDQKEKYNKRASNRTCNKLVSHRSIEIQNFFCHIRYLSGWYGASGQKNVPNCTLNSVTLNGWVNQDFNEILHSKRNRLLPFMSITMGVRLSSILVHSTQRLEIRIEMLREDWPLR